MLTALTIAFLGAASEAAPPTSLADSVRQGLIDPARIERISDVRVDADGDGEPDRLGETVVIAGRATSSSRTLNRDYTFFFMQDASAGISLFSPDLREIANGDSIIVLGQVHQYRGLSQLWVTELRIVRGPRVHAEAVELHEPYTNLEAYEGRLVRVRGRIKGIVESEVGRLALVGSESSFDGLGVYVSLEHSNPPNISTLRVGDEVALAGLLAQHDIEPPYDANYQIFPRSPEDLQITGMSRAKLEAAVLWGGALLLIVLLWLALMRVQVWRRTRELRATAHRFQALIENAYEMITVLDATGRVAFSSQGLERILGWTPTERAGRDVMELIHPDDVEDVRSAFREVVAGTRPVRTLGFRARHADGTWRTLSSVVHNRLSDPDTAGVVVNSRDVTEQQRLEQQLLQSKKLEGIGRLAGGIAHDFNNLMTVVRGHADMLIEGPREDGEVVAGLTEIREAAERATGLTSQLLAFSRKQVLRPLVVDLGTVLRGMENLLRRLIGEDIELDVRIAADAGRVLADPVQFEQVILNLAVNARDAMPKGGKLHFSLANVTLRHADARAYSFDVRTGEFVVLTVRDTGTGIEADVLEHIFEPFFTTKVEGAGTGLGLATVYGIVKQSGGYIRVESDAHGSAFHVYLPRTHEELKPEPDASGDSDIAGGSATILLVEDERALRQMTTRMLERGGYRVLSAANGIEAVEIAQRANTPLDLVLTDVVMPEMGGRELAGHLAVLRPNTPVLFMSGYTDDEMIQRGVIADGSHFLAKPFSAAQLMERIAALLGGTPTATSA